MDVYERKAREELRRMNQRELERHPSNKILAELKKMISVKQSVAFPGMVTIGQVKDAINKSSRNEL